MFLIQQWACWYWGNRFFSSQCQTFFMFCIVCTIFLACSSSGLSIMFPRKVNAPCNAHTGKLLRTKVQVVTEIVRPFFLNGVMLTMTSFFWIESSLSLTYDSKFIKMNHKQLGFLCTGTISSTFIHIHTQRNTNNDYTVITKSSSENFLSKERTKNREWVGINWHIPYHKQEFLALTATSPAPANEKLSF